jgi:hypothetical protein
MRRLVKWTTMLYLFSAVIVGGATLYGRVFSPAWRFSSPKFDLCDGRLCFMTIVPGKTLLTEMKDRLFEYRVSDREGYFLGETDDVEFEIFSERNGTDSARVMSIHVMRKQASLFPFAYIVERFGTPCNIGAAGITSTPGEYAFNISYPAFWVGVTLERHRVDVTSPVYEIVLYDEAKSCDRNSQNPLMPWLGFTSVEHYREYAAF